MKYYVGCATTESVTTDLPGCALPNYSIISNQHQQRSHAAAGGAKLPHDSCMAALQIKLTLTVISGPRIITYSTFIYIGVRQRRRKESVIAFFLSETQVAHGEHKVPSVILSAAKGILYTYILYWSLYVRIRVPFARTKTPMSSPGRGDGPSK